MELAMAIAQAERDANVKTILGVPSLYLMSIHEATHSAINLDIAAQNCYHKSSGAYTGEISADMIQSIGIRYAIVGHSERREYFGETDNEILQKMNLLLDQNISPIFCCGEPLQIRKAGDHKEYVINQLALSIHQLTDEQMIKTVIAYEPIWAIGTGETASPEQAQEMHFTIRESLKKEFGSDIAESISILYGGSVKASNAKELFGQADVDGGLVGGASLNADEFISIINSF
jgi:triosephosphate isomerase